MDKDILLGYVLPVGLLTIGVIATLWIKRQSRMFDEREDFRRQLQRSTRTGDLIHFDNEMMWVVLPDGVQQGVPLRNYQWLLQADSEDRRKYSLDGMDIRWDTLGQKIGIDEVLGMGAAWKLRRAT